MLLCIFAQRNFEVCSEIGHVNVRKATDVVGLTQELEVCRFAVVT